MRIDGTKETQRLADPASWCPNYRVKHAFRESLRLYEAEIFPQLAPKPLSDDGGTSIIFVFLVRSI